MNDATTVARRTTAQEIISSFYARLGKPSPRFMWFDDPLQCVHACNLLSLLRSPRHASERFVFERPVGGRVRATLWSVLEDELQAMVALPRELAPGGYGYWKEFWRSFWQRHEAAFGPVSSLARRAELHGHGHDHREAHRSAGRRVVSSCRAHPDGCKAAAA